MKGTYAAIDVAKYIINKCAVEKCPVTNLHLQKILYFIQKEYLTKKEMPLFDDEIQAWQFGPVVPEVYYHYCGFGSTQITMKYKVNIDKIDMEIIDPIVEDKRNKKPWDLVDETHTPGKAWYITYENGRGNRRIIPQKLIKTNG